MIMKSSNPLLLSALLFCSPLAAQEAPSDVNPGLADASTEARTLWAQLLRASGSLAVAKREPIKAFELKASVLTRNGVESNESDFIYSYLSPNCVRFSLPSDDVMGRFGKKAKEYWLSTPDGTNTIIAGHTYSEDRKTIARMHAVARNFVALTDLGGLTDISSLAQIEPPLGVLVGSALKQAPKLNWIRITSPSFGLQTNRSSDSTERSYTADIGLAKEGKHAHLPVMAIIRDTSKSGRKQLSRPMLLKLDNYIKQDSFFVPKSFFVFYIDPTEPVTRFQAKPAQEIYLNKAKLRPDLKLEDFKPQ
jgi:hypothetical protein